MRTADKCARQTSELLLCLGRAPRLTEELDLKPERVYYNFMSSYSITHEEDENGTFFVTIHKNELLVGGAELSYTPSGWQADHLWVCDNHQRRGLATKIYDLVESTTGLPVLPSDVQTEDAKLFWESRLSKTKVT